MTSTNSASDLLKSFASLRFFGFRGLRLVLSSDIVRDMLVDLLCASASIEPLRRDLELMKVVHHCRCWSPSLLKDTLAFAVFGFRLHLHCLLAGKMISLISY